MHGVGVGAEEEPSREAERETTGQVQGTVSVFSLPDTEAAWEEDRRLESWGPSAKVSLARRVSSDLTPQCRQGMVSISPKSIDVEVPGHAQRTSKSRGEALEMVCLVC